MAGKQKAGDKSVQVQIETIINGIDEKRVREIVDEKLQIALQDFSEEANQTATQRSGHFNKKLVNRMVAEDALSAFADPSFQLLLIEAQKRAASTEREPDYDLLSELMLHRFKKGSNRNVRACISRAVEIVDQISDEALLGLTVLHATTYFLPVSGQIAQGLDVLDGLFSRLIYGDLPTDDEWLDHLDMLDAIRASSLGNMKQLEDYWTSKLEGYNVGGLAKNSEGYKDAVAKLKAVGINEGSLIEHELNTENVRLEVVNKNNIKDLSVTPVISTKELCYSKKVSDEQKKVLEEIYDMTNRTKIDRKKFVDELEKRNNLKRLKEWWNGIHQALQITGAGKVLAHSNAQRIDKTLPPLD